MAYKAYLNEKLFFDTSGNDVSFLLTAAKLELQAGSSGSFTFTVPPGNCIYGDIQKLIDYVDVYRDDEAEPRFSGRVYSIKQKMDTQYEIVCEGLLSVLVDSIYRPVTFDGTLHNLVRAIITSHNSQVEAAKQITIARLGIPDTDVYRDYQNYETSISRLKDLFDSFGGYPYIKKTANGLRFYWLEDMEVGCGQKIELQSNLLDINVEDTSDGICTVLIPLGGEDEHGNTVTIASVNSGNDYLVAGGQYLSAYGYVTKVKEWPDVYTPSILKTKGQAYLEASLAQKYQINVSALDLADAGYSVDSFCIGQRITVRSEPHGIEDDTFNCQSQTLDLLMPENNQMTLGLLKLGYIRNNRSVDIESLISKLSDAAVTRTAMQNAIEHATALITGNEGGYVVLHDSDNDDLPDELLIMDTAEISTASRLWRANLNGFGYSSTGYNGTYGTAITMDGGIVGSFLTALSVTTEKIAAGAITTAKLEAGAVTTEKIAAGAITTAKLDAGAVTVGKIGSGAVSAEKIASGAVTAVKIEDGAVTANKIESGAVTTAKLAAGAVTAGKIEAGAITTAKLAANAVTAAKIDVSDLFAQNITASNFNITGGSIDVTTSSNTDDKIRVTYGTKTAQMRPLGFYVKDTKNSDVKDNKTELSCYSDHIQGQIDNLVTFFLGASVHTSTGVVTSHFSLIQGRSTRTLINMGEHPTDYDGYLYIYSAQGSLNFSVRGNTGTCSAYAWTTLSDRRRKKDIEYLDIEKSAEIIYALKPTKFQYIGMPERVHHGLVAQDVEEVIDTEDWGLIDEVNQEDDNESYKTLAYTELIADLIATVQSQNARITALEAHV